MNRFLSFLLFLISSVCVAAQCDSLDASIAAVIDSKDKTNMLELEKKLINCSDLKDSLALLKHKIGVRFYVDGDLEEAIHYTQEALAIRKTIFENPTFDIGESHHNLGVFYKAFNDLKNAETHFTQAAKVYESLDLSKMADSYWELAGVYFLKGEYDRSLQNLDYALVKAKSFAEESTLLSCYLEYGNVLREQKKYSAAIDSLMQAKKILDQYYLGWDHAALYTNLASNYLLNGQYQDAIEYGNRAVKLWIEFENPYQESNEWNNLGLAYTRLGKFKKAAESLTKGKAIADQHNLYLTISQSQNNLGELFLAQGQTENAIQSFHNGVRTLVTDFDTPDYLQNPSKEQVRRVSLKRKVINDLSDKAKAMLSLYEGNLQKPVLLSCIDALEICDYLVDLLLAEQNEQQSRLFWREKVIPIYEHAISASAYAKDINKAFYFFEKSKAVLLLEQIQYSDAINTLPDSMQDQLHEIRRNLLDALQNFEYAENNDKSEPLKRVLDQQLELEQFNSFLNNQYPEFASIANALEVVDFEDYQKEDLINGSASVHYFYGQNNIYALVITSSDPAEVYDLGSPEPVENSIREYLKFFESSSAIENSPQVYLHLAHQLYQQLIAPLGLDPSEELLIFPDGALAYLPFEALVVEPTEDLATATYLLQKHLVRYAYSASVLAEQKEVQATEQLTVAAYAPFANATSTAQYTTLPFTNDELNQLQSRIAGSYWLDETATRDQFRKDALKHSIFHLSTHAFSSATDGRPRIAFVDTLLYLSDLYAMDLPAELVVLSACQTNIGQLSPGEGVLSLGRGFTHAGARSLVSSLWNVNARATGTVLAAFYEQLQSGTSKYKALHYAKRSYLENSELPIYERSPYYWAGMVYYGGAESVSLKTVNSNQWYWIGTALILILLGGYFWNWGIKN